MGLLAATLAMGVALVATSLLNYRSVVHASGLLSRSQGEAILRSMFFLVRPGQETPAPSTLAALLEEQSGVGLRYVALLDEQGRGVADAGSRLAAPSSRFPRRRTASATSSSTSARGSG